MQADVQKSEALLGVIAHDLMQLAQPLVTDDRTGFHQHDQPAIGHHGLYDLRDQTVIRAQIPHGRIGGQAQADLLQKGIQLLFQHSSRNDMLAKPVAHDEHVIRHGQVGRQTAFGLNDRDAVIAQVGLLPSVHPAAPVIDAAVMQRKVLPQQPQQADEPRIVDRDQPQNVPGVHVQAELVQLGHAAVLIRDPVHAQNFFPHEIPPWCKSSRSLKTTGRVICTSVPTPGMENACRPYSSP